MKTDGRYIDVSDTEFDYVPLACTDHEVPIRDDEGKDTGKRKEVNATFSGKVRLKKIDLLRKLELAPQVDELRGQDKHGFKAVSCAIKNTLDLWVSCALTHLASGKKFSSVADLMVFAAADQIVMEVALGHIDGFSATNEESQGNSKGGK
jgi:hypothetical protein